MSVLPLLRATRQAAPALQRLSDSHRRQLVSRIGQLVLEHQDMILAANQQDLAAMADTDPKKDRLRLDAARIADLDAGCQAVAALPDPTGQLLYTHALPNGLHIEKRSVPLGVVGVIYESRPNVTVDVAALCLRSANAVVLRGGTDALHTNQALIRLLHQALLEQQLPTDLVCLLPPDRLYVRELLEAEREIDILIPRGSQELIDFVRSHARVPVIETGAGVCHTYVERSADLATAARIVINAKTQRPSVCNALDTLLVDRAVAGAFFPLLLEGFRHFEVEVFADAESHAIWQALDYPWLRQAAPTDFGREFLSQKCAVKILNGLDEALAHISLHSSRHSEAIVSSDQAIIQRFIDEVDAAAVYANASTRFTDGGMFGLGAEIGISTQKLHARGPFALEKLVTEKWIGRGNGQTR